MKAEMAADFVENNNSSSSRRAAAKSSAGGQGAQEQEQLPCPRCDSINTKFCYYNNYNFSQPRHFCKACRRYWTQGGTLRDIPVGGGTRKNAKRSRTGHVTTITTSGCAASTTSSVNMGQDYPLHATPVLMPFQGSAGQFCGGDVKGNNGNLGLCGSGGFTSLLSTQGPGFLALSGFGLGLGSGFVGDVGLGGLGRGAWGFAGMGDGGAGLSSNGGSGGGGGAGLGNTWQFDSGETTTTGFVGGDCFSWPDLAISTPGNGLK
ncbi:hypothetical protein ACOSP7_023026 [Xanthoceras sorbifolium]|uniref:Dof zinc finger protein n=1 Tax=Xanthoceras sorbifolium TaxID=99658 RepID=A0ABQ8HQ99_9ROSI|nr:hypothetical protein JRO89_XS08G0175700 [Xanthoceras sorbifolium]